MFLEHAFREDEDGRLAYPELLFSAPKKSGKTTFAAMVTLYAVVVCGGRFAEGFASRTTSSRRAVGCSRRSSGSSRRARC